MEFSHAHTGYMVCDTVTTMQYFCARTLARQPCQNPGARATNEHIGLYFYLVLLRKGGNAGGIPGLPPEVSNGVLAEIISD